MQQLFNLIVVSVFHNNRVSYKKQKLVSYSQFFPAMSMETSANNIAIENETIAFEPSATVTAIENDVTETIAFEPSATDSTSENDPSTTGFDIVADLSEFEKKLNRIALKHTNLAFNVAVIQQQFQIMKNSVSSSSEANSSKPALPASSIKTVADILVTPQPSQRTGVHRHYKMKSSGGMNSLKMMECHEKLQAAKLKADEEKAERKIQRLEKKKMNEIIKNIKKEKAEVRAVQKRAALPDKEVTLKKRGRPSKAL